MYTQILPFSVRMCRPHSTATSFARLSRPIVRWTFERSRSFLRVYQPSALAMSEKDVASSLMACSTLVSRAASRMETARARCVALPRKARRSVDATLQLESPLLSTAPTSLVRVAPWRRQQAGIRRDYPSSAALSGSLGGKWNSMPLRYSCEQVRVRSHQAVMLGKVRRHVFDAFRQWPSLFWRLQICSAVILVEGGSPIVPLHRNRLRLGYPKVTFLLGSAVLDFLAAVHFEPSVGYARLPPARG
jgi:hypothetical protein